MRTIRTSKTLKQVFFNSTDKYDTGSICFTIEECTDKQEQYDGRWSVRTYNRYYKEDGRIYTDTSRRFFLYDDEKKFNAAIRRVARAAESSNINPNPEIF